jgi:hypothetical protein
MLLSAKMSWSFYEHIFTPGKFNNKDCRETDYGVDFFTAIATDRRYF